MARKKAAESALANAPSGPQLKTDTQTPQQVQLQVVLDPTDDTPAYYINYADVTFGMHDFIMSFARLPTKLNSSQLEGLKAGTTMRFEPLLQVILPPTIIPGLIRALSTTKDGFEAQFGEIKEPGVK